MPVAYDEYVTYPYVLERRQLFGHYTSCVYLVYFWMYTGWINVVSVFPDYSEGSPYCKNGEVLSCFIPTELIRVSVLLSK